MTPEERIKQLEDEVAVLRAQNEEYKRVLTNALNLTTGWMSQINAAILSVIDARARLQ